MTGRDYIRAFVDNLKDSAMLEIGPFFSPFLPKNNYNVFYADINNKDDIFAIYKDDDSLPCDLYDKIADIDYVVKDTYQKAIGANSFKLILSSHVIEHTTDLIRHLQDLSCLLYDDGYIVMMIPDKRYCFDCYREITPFRDVIDVYLNNQSSCITRLLFDAHFNACNIHNPREHWNRTISFQENDIIKSSQIDAASLYDEILKSGKPNNMHYWVFTYSSFLDIIRDCLRAKLLPYSLFYAEPPALNTNEFIIILQKSPDILTNENLRIEEIRKIIKVSEEAKTSEVESQRSAFLNSTSWKITKPLRAIKSLLSQRNF